MLRTAYRVLITCKQPLIIPLNILLVGRDEMFRFGLRLYIASIYSFVELLSLDDFQHHGGYHRNFKYTPIQPDTKPFQSLFRSLPYKKQNVLVWSETVDFINTLSRLCVMLFSNAFIQMSTQYLQMQRQNCYEILLFVYFPRKSIDIEHTKLIRQVRWTIAELHKINCWILRNKK